MGQNENDRNELSDFNDIESEELRAYNRGVIMANIHERYIGETGVLAANHYQYYIKEIIAYTSRFPVNEQKGAHEAMTMHLKKRGYVDD